MENDASFICSTCGKRHEGLPMDLAQDEPFYWQHRDEAHNDANKLAGDWCFVYVENEPHYFVRGIVEIPIIDSTETFNYGLWASLSETNFKRYMQVYGTDAELEKPAYFGWLSSSLKGYPETLSLKTNVHLQGGKYRPKIVLEHTEHPLAQEQHHGITMDRVQEILEANEIKLNHHL